MGRNIFVEFEEQCVLIFREGREIKLFENWTFHLQSKLNLLAPNNIYGADLKQFQCIFQYVI